MVGQLELTSEKARRVQLSRTRTLSFRTLSLMTAQVDWERLQPLTLVEYRSDYSTTCTLKAIGQISMMADTPSRYPRTSSIAQKKWTTDGTSTTRSHCPTISGHLTRICSGGSIFKRQLPTISSTHLATSSLTRTIRSCSDHTSASGTLQITV